MHIDLLPNSNTDFNKPIPELVAEKIASRINTKGVPQAIRELFQFIRTEESENGLKYLVNTPISEVNQASIQKTITRMSANTQEALLQILANTLWMENNECSRASYALSRLIEDKIQENLRRITADPFAVLREQLEDAGIDPGIRHAVILLLQHKVWSVGEDADGQLVLCRTDAVDKQWITIVVQAAAKQLQGISLDKIATHPMFADVRSDIDTLISNWKSLTHDTWKGQGDVKDAHFISPGFVKPRSRSPRPVLSAYRKTKLQPSDHRAASKELCVRKAASNSFSHYTKNQILGSNADLFDIRTAKGILQSYGITFTGTVGHHLAFCNTHGKKRQITYGIGKMIPKSFLIECIRDIGGFSS